MLKILEYRQAKGMTQEKLSSLSGIRRSNISRYENGRRVPKLSDIKSIAEALNCTIDELFEEGRENP